MGIIEEKNKKRRKKEDIQNAILSAVKVAGFLSLTVFAPNSLQYLESFGITPGKRKKEIIKNSRDRLIKSGLLEYKDGFLNLTDKGEAKLRSLEIHNWKIKKPRRWDRKWRMLIFDIPEYRKSLRNRIRSTLLDIGFLRLQDSVWIYPYNCEDLVNLLKADFKIGKDLLYIIVDFIENDSKFKKLFGLNLN